MADGVPRYVTAVSKSDTIDGWRDRRSDGGVVIDVQSGDIVIGGLSMPHSPRIYRDRLWLLNSGTDELGWVEPDAAEGKDKFHVLAFCPGFVRGLAFHGNHAFVGLSKPAINASRGWRSTRSSPTRTPSHGAAYRRSIWIAVPSRTVPPRRRGGGTLRPCRRARRNAADGARLC
jgi:uncharacterized protein (TIGR03032 family)